MGNIDKPIYLGQGWTIVHLFVCLTEKAYKKATKHLGAQVGPFPAELHASITNFEPVFGRAAVSVMTFNMEWAKKATRFEFAAIVAHEAVHYAQRVSERQGVRLDTESEAYLVQLLILKITEAVNPFRKR